MTTYSKLAHSDSSPLIFRICWPHHQPIQNTLFSPVGT